MLVDIPKITFRHPTLEDGIKVYNLIKVSPPLDLNSQYYYHIICSDFSKTCVIAELNSDIVGFISAYLKPERSDCLFVWQIAVAEQARGQKLAFNMLQWLFKQFESKIQSLETTISPSNEASQRLFKHFAAEHGAHCQTFPFLNVTHFSDQSHEAEILFRIYPLSN